MTLLDLLTPDIVEHLSSIEALDMELFEAAMRESGVDARSVTERGPAGTHGLPGLLRSLNP
ncbi:hypothetical protein [Nonomuraea sp. NPDC050786]|uniref:hypothetical protein n=1 Tax=Nonomuraea sp. NPDC050786 TaxID=3154840 RepID=UPI0033D78DDD